MPGLSNTVKDHDPDNVWNLNGSFFTAPSTGRYRFDLTTFLQTSALSFCMVSVSHYTAADALIRHYGQGQNVDPSNYGTDFSLSMELQMSAGERVRFNFSTNNPVSCNALPIVGTTTLSCWTTFASGRKVV